MKSKTTLFLALLLAFSCSYVSNNRASDERRKEKDSLITVIDLQIDTLNDALASLDSSIIYVDSLFAKFPKNNKGDWYNANMGKLIGAKSAVIEEKNRLELQRVILIGD